MISSSLRISTLLVKELNIFTFCNNHTKINLNDSLTEEELNLLVEELNAQEITCVCEDNSNPEENC